MNFWEKITGADMTKEMKNFDTRVKKLPANFQEVWEKINLNLWQYADFTGRSLMPVLDGVLGFLEEASAQGQSVHSALGDDIEGFCRAVVGKEGARSVRGKWREKLNHNINKKLGG